MASAVPEVLAGGAARRQPDAIRRFDPSDVSPVAELHRRVFNTAPRMDRALAADYAAYFDEVFFRHPWTDLDVGSLVMQDATGISGFLGVVPQPMVYDGTRLIAARCTQLVVDAEARRRLVGVRLLRELMQSAADLVIADEANDAARRIWEGLGGVTSRLFSLYWACALRPARLAADWIGRGRGMAAVAWMARPAAALIDRLLLRAKRDPSRSQASSTRIEPLDPSRVADFFERAVRQEAIRPVYDESALRWVLDRARRPADAGRIEAWQVCDAEEKPIGWFIYGTGTEGMGEVLQLAALPGREPPVLEQLFEHARRGPSPAIRGRFEPRFWQPLTRTPGLLHRRGPWVLAHARDREVLHAFEAGRAWCTRLEGEWCLRFR
ncbi:MAG: hypothetical protein JSV80_15170 [Acidobacteriota bacterium]|nr:MAG: hypothetical protein JSV80_15170 [Acidobacteriota bacterium]